jgi:hypothetical protein
MQEDRIEIETETEIRFRLLESVTVTNFITNPNNYYIKLARCKKSNEYYLLENAELYKDKIKEIGNGYYIINDKQLQIVVHEVNDEQELLGLYISSFLANTLNVFKVLLLFKEGKLTNLNERLQLILEKNKEIPDDALIELSNMLEEIANIKKNKSKRIVVEPSVLEAVKRYYELLNDDKYKELLKELTIKDVLLDLRHEDEDRVEFSNADAIIHYIERFIEKMERLLMKEVVESEDADTNIDADADKVEDAYNDKDKKPIEVKVGEGASVQQQQSSLPASTPVPASLPSQSTSAYTPTPTPISTPSTSTSDAEDRSFKYSEVLFILSSKPLDTAVKEEIIRLLEEMLSAKGYDVRLYFKGSR